MANPRANLGPWDLNHTVPVPVPKLVANACLWDFQFFMRLNRFHFLLPPLEEKKKAKGRRRRRHLDRAKKMWHKGRRTAPHHTSWLILQKDPQTDRKTVRQSTPGHEWQHLWRLKGLSNTSSILTRENSRVREGCKQFCQKKGCHSTRHSSRKHLVFFRLLKLPAMAFYDLSRGRQSEREKERETKRTRDLNCV